MQRPYFYFTAASQCVFNASAFSCQQKASQQHRNALLLLSYYWKYKLFPVKQANLYWSVKERFLFFPLENYPHCWVVDSWEQSSLNFSLLNVNVISLSWVTLQDLMISKKLNQQQRMGEAAALPCYEWTGQTSSQTDKQWTEGQVKCGRNVTDSWGRHVDPGPHATWRVPGVSPSSPVRTRMSSLPEGNQVGSVGEVI